MTRHRLAALLACLLLGAATVACEADVEVPEGGIGVEGEEGGEGEGEGEGD